MSTALQRFSAQRVEAAPVPATLDDAIRIGELMVMFDADGNAGNAIAKVIAGQELGIGPMASIRGFHMIKGKPSLSGELVATLIKRSGRYDFRSKVEVDRATITVYDRGEALDPVTFTMDDAKAAGLTGNDNYKKYGADMLFNRAIVRAARRHCPEVIGGAVYLESDGAFEPVEEPSAIAVNPETGEVIDSTAVDSPTEAEAPDTATIARELMEASGDGDAFVAAMKTAGITSEDLSDPEKLTQALAIADDVRAGVEAAANA